MSYHHGLGSQYAETQVIDFHGQGTRLPTASALIRFAVHALSRRKRHGNYSLAHSSHSNRAGSTFSACRAGIQMATSPVSAIVATTPAMVLSVKLFATHLIVATPRGDDRNIILLFIRTESPYFPNSRIDQGLRRKPTMP
jgi:hypothetical protein